ncbi:flavin reductase family protein [Rhodococcus jostii]|uniref:flavin reductase family protein n=1 Tax=Rhodococcus jostii TaxID=132919 RepID=UPI000A6EA2ED|nr:flavin reductase family protein [Rhodococcus jostii]
MEVVLNVRDSPPGTEVGFFGRDDLSPRVRRIALTSTTWPPLRRAPSVGVSVLADAHASTTRALAPQVPDRFAGIDWVRNSSGAVFTVGAALWLNCSTYDQVR